MLICNRKFHFFTANFRVTSTSATGSGPIVNSFAAFHTEFQNGVTVKFTRLGSETVGEYKTDADEVVINFLT